MQSLPREYSQSQERILEDEARAWVTKAVIFIHCIPNPGISYTKGGTREPRYGDLVTVTFELVGKYPGEMLPPLLKVGVDAGNTPAIEITEAFSDLLDPMFIHATSARLMARASIILPMLVK
jgi:hypothetical protein